MQKNRALATRKQLRLCQERLQILLHLSDLGFWEWSQEGGTVSVCDHITRLLGYDLSEQVDVKRAMAYLHPQDQAVFHQLVADCLQGKLDSFQSEFRLHTRSGCWRWVACQGKVVRRDELGAATKMVGTVLDIHSRKISEEALIKSEATLRSILKAAPVGIGVVVDRVIEWTNERLQQMVGYAPYELIGQSARVLYESDEEFDRVGREKYAQIRNHGLGALNTRFRRKDGSLMDVLLSSAPINAENLEAGVAFTVQDISEQKRLENKLMRLALYDPLTGLPNRLYLTEHLSHLLGSVRWDQQRTAVILMNLLDFHRINEFFSHAVGDKVLRGVSQRLQENVPTDVMIARLGNDEFAIVLPAISDAEDACQTAEALMHFLDEPIVVDGHEIFIRAHAGVSIFPDDGEDVSTLLKRANIALSFSKAYRGDRVRRFHPSMHQKTFERLTLTNRLQRAVQQNELELYYQPQFEINHAQPIGFEALLRWNHPDLGMILPGEFICVAEETGLVSLIGQWVIRAACRQYAEWQRTGRRPLPIAINISAIQFNQSGFVSQIKQALDEFQIAPQGLTLEVTESVLMKDALQASAQLDELRKMGIKVHIDDFGIGYSSLNYLRNLPVDSLKIDQQFIRDLDETQEGDENSAALVKAIITLGHCLNLQVLAEGVETRQQLEKLRELGCDSAQGYLFARPQPAHMVWNNLDNIPLN